MDKHELSRRKLLAGLGSAGVGGGIVGTGTAAFFSDGDVFGNNRLNAGALRLAVGNDANSDSDERIFEVDVDSPEGSTTFPVSLPATDRQDNENNPAYVWLRTSCPESNPDPTDFAESLDVSLSYVCGEEGGTEVNIVEGQSLVCFKQRLANGFQLDPDACSDKLAEPRCFDPEESVELRLDWNLDSDYEGDESATLTFEFTARQCRHGDGTTNPFPTTECEIGKDISWVAFCADAAISENDVEFTIDGPKLTVSSVADPDSLNAVLLKNGQFLEEFIPSSSDVVPSGNDDSASFTTVPCGPDGWTITSYEQEADGFKNTDRTNNDPCPDSSENEQFKFEVSDGGGS